jgi:hypothetical protein
MVYWYLSNNSAAVEPYSRQFYRISCIIRNERALCTTYSLCTSLNAVLNTSNCTKVRSSEYSLKQRVNIKTFLNQSRQRRQQHQVSLCTAGIRICLSGVSTIPRFSLYCTLPHSWSCLLLTDVAVRIFCVVPRTSSCLPPDLNMRKCSISTQAGVMCVYVCACVCGGYVQQSCYVETIRTVLQPNDSDRKADGGTTENC